MLSSFSSISREKKTDLTMAAVCSQYLQRSQQKCSCKEIPAPKYLVLHSNGLHLCTKKETKHCEKPQKMNPTEVV